MKIILVGAKGTIGQAIDRNLSARHEVVRVGKTSGDYQVDMADPASIDDLFSQIGTFDALVCAAGSVHFGALAEFTDDQYGLGLRDKLMGQVNLVMRGMKTIADGGSFTLTSGLLSDAPIRYGASASMVNAGLDGFVRGAAVELPRGIRINAVSPTLIEESLKDYGPFFPGIKPVPADDAALAYQRSVEGVQTGCIMRVGWSRDDL